MKLKTKTSLLISLLFSILFGASSIVVFVLFSNFRKEEFENRLKKSAITSIKLLVNIKEIDNHLLKVIDHNTIHELQDEKTIIFDSHFKLIYSSIDDAKVEWDISDLKYLKKKKTFFRLEGDYEMFGINYKKNNKDFYSLISAKDDHGKRKLSYLIYILIFTYIVFTLIFWIFSSYVVTKLFSPLTIFHHKIKNINENNLDTRIEVKKGVNEIDLIANEFNLMLTRIDKSYKFQKEFTANVSHELRTPLSRITVQIENRISDPTTSEESKVFLLKLISDTNQLTELINSLLVLAKLNVQKDLTEEVHRIDEIIFDCIGKIMIIYPDFKINLDIDYEENLDTLLEIPGNKSLLEIAIINLLKNACSYSDNKEVKVYISNFNNNLKLQIINSGKVISEEERLNLYQPFMRGENSKEKNGLGLGLRIVHRIIMQHNAEIQYSNPSENLNIFTLLFKKD